MVFPYPKSFSALTFLNISLSSRFSVLVASAYFACENPFHSFLNLQMHFSLPHPHSQDSHSSVLGAGFWTWAAAADLVVGFQPLLCFQESIRVLFSPISQLCHSAPKTGIFLLLSEDHCWAALPLAFFLIYLLSWPPYTIFFQFPFY